MLTVKDSFAGNLYQVSGLVVTVDDVTKTLDASSQITFTPTTEQYVLKVTYQSLELYSATPAGTNVQVKSVTKVVASDCGTVLLSATLDGQTKSVTCDAGAGTMYFVAPTEIKSLEVTSTKHKTFTANVEVPTQFETTVAAAMLLNDVTLTLQGFGASLYSFTGLVAKIDGVAKTLSDQSQITFEPATEAYVLTVEYQNLQLYNEHPAATTVQVPGVVKVTTSNCATYSLSVAFDTQTGTIVCSAGTGELYLKQTSVKTNLTISHTQL